MSSTTLLAIDALLIINPQNDWNELTCHWNAAQKRREIRRQMLHLGYAETPAALESLEKYHQLYDSLPSPIDDLPQELLEYILLLFYAELRPGWLGIGSRREIIKLTHVCQKWRMAALSIAQLWSEIDISRHILAHELIERSEGAPIRLLWQSPSRGFPLPHPGHSVWRSLCLSSQRLSSMHIVVDQDTSQNFEQIPTNFYNNLPFLPLMQMKSLVLSTLDPRYGSHTANTPLSPWLSSWIQNSLPLTSIVLVGSSFTLSSLIFGKHLCHLHLQKLGNQVFFSELISVLNRCKQLESLILIDLQISLDPPNPQKTTRPALLLLRWLDVQAISQRLLELLLSHLVIPNGVFLHLSLEVSSLSVQISRLLHTHRSTIERLRQNSILNFTIRPKFVAVNRPKLAILGPSASPASKAVPPRDADSIELSIQDNQLAAPQESLSYLSCELESVHCRELTINFFSGESTQLFVLDWQICLSLFPGLESLSIQDSGDTLLTFFSVIQALAHPYKDKILCESLQTIDIELQFSASVSNLTFGLLGAKVRELRDQGRMLKEVNVKIWVNQASSRAEEAKRLLKGRLGPYVGKLTISVCEEEFQKRRDGTF